MAAAAEDAQDGEDGRQSWRHVCFRVTIDTVVAVLDQRPRRIGPEHIVAQEVPSASGVKKLHRPDTQDERHDQDVNPDKRGECFFRRLSQISLDWREGQLRGRGFQRLYHLLATSCFRKSGSLAASMN